MAAVANQVHSTAQQIGARIGWNPIDAATQPPTGTRERVFLIHGLIIATWASRIPAFQAHLHLSPAVLGRSLMMAAIGSVLAMTAAGRLINKFGSLSIVIGSTLGFGLALPLIAESNTVLTLSVALLFYGAMAGSMDVAMNTHAVMLEKRYQRHIMSSFHALFSFGGMAGSASGGLVASRAVPAGIHFWVSGIALAARMSGGALR
ncbi:MAG: MFS transporter [Candidatus Sulfotelmatobacter sp.]